MNRLRVTLLCAPALLARLPEKTYQQAFSEWRACVIEHRYEANPPPECDEQRDVLRQSMAMRRKVN